MTPLKAEYIGADQLPLIIFRLQLCGGPYIPITPFYKRGCQDKYLPHDGKTAEKWSCRPAPVMERDAVRFPLPQIHRAFVTTPIRFQRRQAEWLCSANHGSI